jgi:hypothetical protein
LTARAGGDCIRIISGDGVRKAAVLGLVMLVGIAVKASWDVTDDPNPLTAVDYDGGNAQGDSEVYGTYETIGDAYSNNSGWVNYYLKHTWTDINMSGNHTSLEVKYWIDHTHTEYQGSFEDDELFLQVILHVWEKSGTSYVYKGNTQTKFWSNQRNDFKTISKSVDFTDGELYKVRLEIYGHLDADDGDRARLYTNIETASQAVCYLRFKP